MSYANPSTVWASLAVLNPAQGAIPFIYTDNQTPTINVANLWFNQTALQLSVGCGGDQTGTDTLNIYGQYDAFLPMSSQAAIIAQNGLSAITTTTAMAGMSVSAANGTAAVPSTITVGQLIGGFSAWAYLSVPQAYTPIGGIFYYAPATGTAGNLGGEMHLATRADAGVLTDRVTLDNAGVLQPSTVTIVANASYAASARLGKANKGFAALSLAYVLANVTGNVTQNTPAGQVQIAAGNASIQVSNNLVTANSIVIPVIQTADATLTSIKSCVCGAGFFTITGNTNATGTVKIGYLVIGTDS